MRKAERDLGKVELVAPGMARARSAAAAFGERLLDRRCAPVSLSSLLARGPASDALVVCPGGADLARDLDFLTRLSERVLWPTPDPDLLGAIAGLLGHDLPEAPPQAWRRDAHRQVAFLFEGRVTPARARAALASDARHWIAESVRHVRLSRRGLVSLQRQGVRWSALRPVRVLALIASPALVRARRRWHRLLPAETPVWVWEK
ncbi:MAG TPA: hypothetical protein VJA66_12010 [Thermoanaerobaculia bacterium]